MTAEYLRLGIDALILFFLIMTVYFAFRLSKNLTEFRSYRGELQDIMRTLGGQLERAQGLISDIKTISQTSGQDIDDMMQKSRLAAEDLRAVNAAADALANRLERLATHTTTTERGQTSPPAIQPEPPPTPPQNNDAYGDNKVATADSIQALLNDLKSEIQRDDDLELSGEHAAPAPDIPEFLRKPQDDAPNFTSETERDLYEALRKNRNDV